MRCPISCLTTSLGGVLGGPPRQPKRQNLKKTNGFSTISLKSMRFARDILKKVQSRGSSKRQDSDEDADDDNDDDDDDVDDDDGGGANNIRCSRPVQRQFFEDVSSETHTFEQKC